MTEPIKTHRVKAVKREPVLPPLPRYVVLTTKPGDGGWMTDHVTPRKGESHESALDRMIESEHESGYTTYVLELENPDGK